MSQVEARLARGQRDVLPAQMLARQTLIDAIRQVFESYGYVPLGTPAIEHKDVLLGPAGAEAHQQIFDVEAPDEDGLGLRFDLTVPLSRVVSQYPDLPRPFRRYQVAPVWRADKPDPGRFREFIQFDIDSVGAPVGLADAELLAASCDTLNAVGVGGFRIRLSSRRLLETLVHYAGIPTERTRDVFRVLDKLDRIGIELVRRELAGGYVDSSGDEIPGLGLDVGQIEAVDRFLATPTGRGDTLEQLRSLLGSTEGAVEALGELQQISDRLDGLGYGADQVVVDVSIARGLAYYTGPVFEAVLNDAPKFGSVIGGGRYDGLVRRFLGEDIPATGASIGVDRLLAALAHLGRLEERTTTAVVLVTVMDAELTDHYLQMAAELRAAGLPTELYVGHAKRLGKQLKYADRKGIPVSVICGSDERDAGQVTVKAMSEGREKASEVESREDWVQARFGQQTVARQELVETVKRALGRL